jgi:hypothetical protein
MRPVLQLLVADVRRVWPLACLLTGVHAFRLVLAEWGPLWSVWQPNGASLTALGTILLVVDLLLCAVTLARIVHADPLGDDRAFWLTRPVSSWTMFASKLAALAGALVLLPGALNAVWLSWYGATSSAIAAASVQLALSRLGWIAVGWLVAAATPSLAAFFAVLAGALAATVGAFMASFSWSLRSVSAHRPLVYDPPLPLPDDTSTYLALLVLVALGLAVVRAQYWLKRWQLTAPFAVVSIVLACVMLGQRTPVIAMANEPATPAWLLDARQTRVEFGGLRQLDTGSRSTMPSEREPIVHGETWVRVTGIPNGYSVAVLPHAARLTSATGLTVDCWVTPALPDGSPHERLSALSFATQAPDLLGPHNAPRPGVTATQVLVRACSAPVSTMRRVAGTDSRLDTRLEVRLTHHQLKAVLPLTMGASVRLPSGHVVQIATIAPDGAGSRILLRRIRYPSLRPQLAPILTIGIRDPMGKTRAIETTVRRTDALFPLGFTLTLRSDWGSFGTPWGSEWQSLEEISVPAPDSVDAVAWPRKSSLVLWESAYAGHTIRSWVADHVYVAPLSIVN